MTEVIRTGLGPVVVPSDESFEHLLERARLRVQSGKLAQKDEALMDQLATAAFAFRCKVSLLEEGEM